MIAEPRKDVIGEFLHHIRQHPDFAAVEIAYNAKLPDILWKFYRTCDKDTVINPHFYPLAAFQGRIITPIPPLRDRDTNKNSGEWTEHIVVHGDDTEGRIRLTSEDGTIARLFGAVVRCVVGPLTLFKGLFASRSKTAPWCSQGLCRYRWASIIGGGCRSSIYECSQSQMLPMVGFFLQARP